MDLLDWYILFCLTTAITASIELLYPVIAKQVEEVGGVDSKLTIYIVFLLVSTLFAPFIFFSCIIPSWGDRFKISLHKGLFLEE
jgi:hypothetical protein